MKNALRPDRVVLGVHSRRAEGVLRPVYETPLSSQDSPALELPKSIHDLGSLVTVYDPVAMDRARQACPEFRHVRSLLGGASDANMFLLLTGWHESREAGLEVREKTVTHPKIADGCHVSGAGQARIAAGLAAPHLHLRPGTRAMTRER